MSNQESSDRKALSGFHPRDVFIQLLGDDPTLETKKEVGELLAKLIGKEPYTPYYIENIYLGRQPISGNIRKALYAYWCCSDEENPLCCLSVNVIVKAIPGSVIVGSLVLAKTVYCNYRYCAIPFIPRTPNQKYCCKDHRLAEWNERRKDARKK